MSKRVFEKIKKDGLLSLPRSFIMKVKYFIYQPKVKLEKVNLKPIAFGNNYGGKRFFDFDELVNSTVVSCGLGEDASFDVEFAARYGATMIIVDPTPRAIDHYEEIMGRLETGDITPSNSHGKRASDLYDLSEISLSQLVLEKFALWTKVTRLNFFAPKNPTHVSYSITNFQNNYSLNTEHEHIEVTTTTLQMLIDKYSIGVPSLLKLDIEGAEIEVLEDMLRNRIYPIQIAVEFDGFNFPCRKAQLDFARIDALLRQNGYLCYDFDGQADFLYVAHERVQRELATKL